MPAMQQGQAMTTPNDSAAQRALPECTEERKRAEQEYACTAFDYVAAPIGSRDWTLYWKGWQAALASEAGEWMPIESAPKFVEVLVTGFDMNDPRADRHYAVAINGHDGWIQSQDLGICTPLEFLTHWMPIQPAPTGESHE